ncbi:4-hydroxythreonine-4-phosphate dehydrogenase PdxA [Nitrosomonas eutropha]|uniref:4-hydroxythreonine-4-phosphate dehydrogenase PdxA n=1 Tax=Nitrosomonas eutropha TaxID=916 RepID=UPI0008B14FA7|nr:4-hydroxythreonine-4-phosphate dehydrogenase PdxA [Nitrosomonas eutropha]SEI37192.1 4-hydroxythreonine-4-phosphate dehydrogenase [Nitrosomonas eutropha]
MTIASIPRLVVTVGEPAGIGPDLSVQVAQQDLPYQLTVIADRNVLEQRAEKLRLPLQVLEVDSIDDLPCLPPHKAGCVHVLHVPVKNPVVTGQLDVGNAAYVLTTLQLAVAACSTRKADAIVTAPVHKGIISESGIPFSGHTEYLSELTNSHAVMMLAGGGMRVTLATTHLPLKDVPAAITPERLEQKLRIIHHDLVTRFVIKNPCIAVAGLNPHAGESGHLGREEIDIIIPVLTKLRNEGMNLLGPLPADTLFNPPKLKEYDCIFAMYHDQGLPTLKHASFGHGVNISLGMPIIRTSVDHGTALELAGTGQADPGSIHAAIEMASTLVRNTRNNSLQANQQSEN